MRRRAFLATLAGAPLLLRTDPDAFARRLGGTAPALALVTADEEAAIVAVELRTGRIYRRIPTLPGPRSIETVGWTAGALVAHTAAGALTVVDAATLRSRRVRGRIAAPRYVATRRGDRYAYVSDSERREVAVVDLAARAITGRIGVGGPARHLSLSPSGRSLWVVLGSKAHEVAVLDVSRPGRPRHVRSFQPPSLAHDVAFAPDGAQVWLTSGELGELAVYHARSGRLLRRLAADAPPQHLVFAGGLAQVTSGDAGLLRLHSLRTGRVLRTARLPLGSYNVAAGWGRVFTPSLSQGTLCVLDEVARVERRRRVASSAHDACFLVAA